MNIILTTAWLYEGIIVILGMTGSMMFSLNILMIDIRLRYLLPSIEELEMSCLAIKSGANMS